MNLISQMFRWLNDPLNWQGSSGVIALLGTHLAIAGAALGIACVVAWPLALYLGHTGHGGNVVVSLANGSRALPTLALLTLFSSVSATLFGNLAAVISLAIFAVPPLLANAYIGLRGVDDEVRDAAQGMGLTTPQLLRQVEVPLAMPMIAGGFRTAAVQVVATATLAALVGGGGLGLIIQQGLGVQDKGQTLAGGLLVAVLALVIEGLLALLQRALTPKPLRTARTA